MFINLLISFSYDSLRRNVNYIESIIFQINWRDGCHEIINSSKLADGGRVRERAFFSRNFWTD